MFHISLNMIQNVLLSTHNVCEIRKIIFNMDAYLMACSEYIYKNSEYDQDIPQSQTADKPMARQGRVTQQSRDTRKTN